MVLLLWKNIIVFSQKIKHRITYDLAVPLLGLYSKKIKAGSQRDVCTSVFIVALFIIAKNSSIHQWWRDKQNLVCVCIYTHTYTHTHTHTQLFSLKKKGNSDIQYNMDEPRRHYANWKKPVTKNKYCMIPLTWGTSSSQNHRDRKQKGGCQELGDGSLGGINGYKVSVLQDERVLETDGGKVVQEYQCT